MTNTYDFVDLPSKGWLKYQVEPANNECLESFDDLVRDQYALGCNRYRRFSQYKASFLSNSWALEKLPHAPFVQSKEYNKHSGGVLRHFEQINYDFSDYINEFMIHLKVDRDQDYQIDLHQYRVQAQGEEQGNPVPEGPHQDGHEVVGIVVFRRHLISGAENSLYKLDGTEFLKTTLEEGEVIFLKDEELLHNATPIKAMTDEVGFRDYLVVNINRWKYRRYGADFEKGAI